MEADRATINLAERVKINQDAWVRLKNLFPWTLEDENSKEVKRQLELQDGYQIDARYLPTNWLEIVVYKENEGVLSFVMRESGLQSIGSRNPSLVFGSGEVKLGGFGIGLIRELQTLHYTIDQSRNMDILGFQLVEWLESSVKGGELMPLDVSIKFPLLPQK